MSQDYRNYFKKDYFGQTIRARDASFTESFSVYKLVEGELGWSTPYDMDRPYELYKEIAKLNARNPGINVEIANDVPNIKISKGVMARSATREDIGYILLSMAPREIRADRANTPAAIARQNPNLVQRILADVKK